MEFLCSRAIVALLLMSLSPIHCSNLDQDIQAAFTISQLALSEQSSTMAQHSQALSQNSQALARILEQNQLQSEGVSQALVQMAQGFQEAISQLTQELSRQHSSFLSHLTEGQCSQQSAAFKEMSENVAQLFRNSEERKTNLSKIDQSLREAFTSLTLEQAETNESLQASQSQLSETTNENLSAITQQLQEYKTTITQELSQIRRQATSQVPFGFEKVSDGWFRIVKVKKSWDDARQYCQDRGTDIATPPADFYALKRYLWDEIGETEAWLSGRLDGHGNWKYIDGLNVDSSHWTSGEPGSIDDCVVMYGHKTPPLWGRPCDNPYFFVCRYG